MVLLLETSGALHINAFDWLCVVDYSPITNTDVQKNDCYKVNFSRTRRWSMEDKLQFLYKEYLQTWALV